MRKITKDKKGLALLTVVLFFLVMVILLSGLLFSTVKNLKNTQTAQKHTSVYYAAESGLNIYISYIQEKVDLAISEKWNLAQFENELISMSGVHLENSFRENLGNAVIANITISEPADKVGMPGYRFISLVSEGQINDVNRIVKTDFVYRLESGSLTVKQIEFPAAIITQGSISQDPGNKTPIEGPIASNSGVFNLQECPVIYDTTNKAPISYPTTVTPTITGCSGPVKDPIAQIVEFGAVDKFDVNLGLTGFNTPKTNSGGVLDLKCESGCITSKKQFEISNWPVNDNLNIKLYGTSQSDITILKITNSPSLIGNKITFSGTGRLVIFFNMTANLTINNGVQNLRADNSGVDSSRLNIVLIEKNTTDKFNLSIGNIFYGSVLSDANIGFPSWNNKKFYGYLVTNTRGVVNLQANSDIGTLLQPVYLYLPLADFELASGITVYGTIVANSYSAQSNKTTVKYVKMLDTYPFSIWAPLPFATTETSGEVGDTSVEYQITPFKEN